MAIASLFCSFMVFAVVIIVIIRLARANANRSVVQSPPASVLQTNVTTELGPDGFWISNCPVPPSSVVDFSYWSNGRQYSARVAYQPDASGRQFIYTGVKPDRVSISQIIEPSHPDFSDTILPGLAAASVLLNSGFRDDGPPMPPPPPRPPEPPQFPSAY